MSNSFATTITNIRFQNSIVKSQIGSIWFFLKIGLLRQFMHKLMPFNTITRITKKERFLFEL